MEGNAPFAERLAGYAAWLMGVGPVPYDLFLDSLAQRWGCRPSEAEEEDAERVDRILEAAAAERIFQTPGKRWTDEERELFEEMRGTLPDQTTRMKFLSRHAKQSGET